MEHIVIDGGSTDGSLAVLAQADGIRWTSEPDPGQAAAINKGLFAARGHVLTWLNADDVLARDAVERAVGAVAHDPDVGWVYGNIEVRRGDRGWIRRAPHRLRTRQFASGNPVPQPGTFFTAVAWQRVGGRLDESLHLAFDYELWLRFASAGVKATHIDATVATFEIHSRSKTALATSADFWGEISSVLERHGLAAARGRRRDRLAPRPLRRGSPPRRRGLRHAADAPPLPGRELVFAGDVERGFRQRQENRLDRFGRGTWGLPRRFRRRLAGVDDLGESLATGKRLEQEEDESGHDGQPPSEHHASTSRGVSHARHVHPFPKRWRASSHRAPRW